MKKYNNQEMHLGIVLLLFVYAYSCRGIPPAQSNTNDEFRNLCETTQAHLEMCDSASIFAKPEIPCLRYILLHFTDDTSTRGAIIFLHCRCGFIKTLIFHSVNMFNGSWTIQCLALNSTFNILQNMTVTAFYVVCCTHHGSSEMKCPTFKINIHLKPNW